MSNKQLKPEKIVGHQFEKLTYSYTDKDTAFYALCIGAAQNPVDDIQLQYVYENHEKFKALPSMAVLFPFGFMEKLLGGVPGLNFNPMMLLHGEQEVRLLGTIPTNGTLTSTGKISHIYDKGKAASIIIDATTHDEQGKPICFNRSTVFIRGIGGFGGPRGPVGQLESYDPPNRVPDAIVRYKTLPNAALWYRLSSGDANPLHADPQMAAIGGFDRPILHGLCTLGYASRAILESFCDNDVNKFKSIKVRFARHVFPGETLVIEMWKVYSNKIVFRCSVEGREGYVLSDARAELEIAGIKSNL